MVLSVSRPADAACEVVGCWDTVAAAYLMRLHDDAEVVEFGVCAMHFAALQVGGGQPQLVHTTNNGRQWSRPKLIVN